MQQAAVYPPPRVKVGNNIVIIQQRLGNGAFGVVYKVIDEASGTVCALKDVPCLNDSALHNAVREATTLNKISHVNVIAIMGADQFCDAQRVLHMLLLTEYCPGGSLNERLARPSSDETNLKWISQIAAALAHLHSRGVVHRDLKADNVLLTATEDVKLADFGLAREYIALKRNDAQQDDGSWMTIYTQYYMSSGIGPIHWVAPEFFTGRYTEKAGVFSLGTLFFAILARDSIVIDGKIIYGAFVNISGAGKVGLGLAMAQFDPRIEIEFPSYAQGPYNLQRVALKTLQYNPEVRPSAQQVYEEVISIRQQQYSLQQPQFLQPTATAFPPTTPPGFAPAAAFLPPTTPPVFTQTAAGFPLTTPSGFAPAATVLPLTTPPSFASTTVPWPQFWPQPPQ